MMPGLRALALLSLAGALAACGAPAGERDAAPAATARAGASDAAPAGAADAAVLARAPLVTVYKSPTCGCCTKWEDHMRAHGFRVESHAVPDVTPTKVEKGLPPPLASCHTAVVDGYVLEGHVPAEDVKRLLQERPAVVGLAVPGMPMGSPGMEGLYSEEYEVLTFGRDGATTVWARHGQR